MSVLGNSGIDIDPSTGLPVYRQPCALNTDHLHDVIVESNNLMVDCNSDGGQKIIAVVEKLIIERVEELTKGDPACSKLIELLDCLGRKMNLAPVYAERLIQKKLRIKPPR
jgi:hypothetical protein